MSRWLTAIGLLALERLSRTRDNVHYEGATRERFQEADLLERMDAWEVAANEALDDLGLRRIDVFVFGDESDLYVGATDPYDPRSLQDVQSSWWLNFNVDVPDEDYYGAAAWELRRRGVSRLGRFHKAYLPRPLRGKGLGFSLYDIMIDFMHFHGTEAVGPDANFFGETSAEALNVWSGLSDYDTGAYLWAVDPWVARRL